MRSNTENNTGRDHAEQASGGRFLKVYEDLIRLAGTPAALVYGALEFHVHRKAGTRECWPSLRRLGELTGYGRTKLKELIAKLIELGCVRRRSRSTAAGQQSNVYEILGVDCEKSVRIDSGESGEIPTKQDSQEAAGADTNPQGRQATTPQSPSDHPPVAQRPGPRRPATTETEGCELEDLNRRMRSRRMKTEALRDRGFKRHPGPKGPHEEGEDREQQANRRLLEAVLSYDWHWHEATQQEQQQDETRERRISWAGTGA